MSDTESDIEDIPHDEIVKKCVNKIVPLNNLIDNYRHFTKIQICIKTCRVLVCNQLQILSCRKYLQNISLITPFPKK